MGDEDKPKTKLEKKTNILCIITSIFSEVILDMLFRIHSFFAHIVHTSHS